MKANLVTAICDMLVWTVENHDHTQGICWHLNEYRYDIEGAKYDPKTTLTAYTAVRDEMFRWGRRVSSSVIYTFPVPRPEEMDEEHAYNHARAAGTLWDSTTEYGRNRWAMLAHLCEWASNLPVD